MRKMLINFTQPAHKFVIPTKAKPRGGIFALTNLYEAATISLLSAAILRRSLDFALRATLGMTGFFVIMAFSCFMSISILRNSMKCAETAKQPRHANVVAVGSEEGTYRGAPLLARDSVLSFFNITHFALCNQQNYSSQNQKSTDHIEYCRSDTTRRWQHNTGSVRDFYRLDGSICSIDCSINRNDINMILQISKHFPPYFSLLYNL